MAITLIAPPGLSDLPDSALNAEEIAQGQHAVKILENTKFGVVRPEFFYMGRFSDGQTVARPTSKVDNLRYQASEVIYLWEVVMTADPREGRTSGAGTIFYFDYRVEQRADNDPGLVHCKTRYSVQGGQGEDTPDGELSVWAIGIRGLDQLDLAAIPAWTNVLDADFDLDSAWREDRLKDLNAAAKRSVVQAEFFDLGEFGNGQTVPQPVSDVDGFTYPYADLVFLTSWRWTPAFATGIVSGPPGSTLARLEKSVNGATGVVDTTVTYRLGGPFGGDTITQDGRVRVFAFGFRAGITATGTVSFTDLNANVFLPGKPPLDDDALVMVRNSKFAALRPEFFVTTQAHGTTVPLPTSPIDSYAYARAELIYLYSRNDTAAPGAIGSLLTLHGFIRQDTGAVTLNTLYYRQGGAITNPNNGTFRVVTVALRTKDVEVDSDPLGAGGGEPGFEGGVDNDLVSGGGILLMRNPDFESGDRDWTKSAGFTIVEDAANAYDGDWVGKFVGTSNSAMRNSVAIPCSPGNIVLGHCFIKRISGDGSPRVRISWRDASKGEFASTNGDVVTSSSYALSRVVATAPAGTFFAVVECLSGAPTVSQTAYYDQFHAAFFPIDLGDVPDSPTRLAPDPNYFDGSRRPTRLRRASDDLLAADIFRYQGSGSHDADNVPPSAARTFISPSYVDGSLRPDRLRRPAADITAAQVVVENENITRLGGRTLQNIGDYAAGGRYGARAGSRSGRPSLNPLTATDTGSATRIDMGAVTWKLDSGGGPAYNAANVGSLSYGTVYYAYLVDSPFAGGSKTLYASTVKEDAFNAEGRLYMGAILTPALGGGDTTGFGDGGAGAQIGGERIHYATAHNVSGVTFNPTQAYNKNWADYGYATAQSVNLTVATSWLETITWGADVAAQLRTTLSVRYKFKILADCDVGANFARAYIQYYNGSSWVNLESVEVGSGGNSVSGPTEKTVAIPASVVMSDFKMRAYATARGGGGGEVAYAYAWLYDAEVKEIW